MAYYKRGLTCIGSTISVFTSVYIITSLSNSKLDKRMFSMMNIKSCNANDQKPSLVFLSTEHGGRGGGNNLYIISEKLSADKTEKPPSPCITHFTISTQCPHKYAVELHCGRCYCTVMSSSFCVSAKKKDENLGNTHLLRDQRALGSALFFHLSTTESREEGIGVGADLKICIYIQHENKEKEKKTSKKA